MTIATLFPIILVNRWTYNVSALLAGVGVGLFIDEVGKFITQNNDYFYPPAAPIIYAFFLVTVLVYLQVRRPPSHDPRTELYYALDAIEEVLNRDLDVVERDELDKRLLFITAQTEQYPDLSSLAKELSQFLHNQDLIVIPDQPSILERWHAQLAAWASRHIDRAKLRVFIVMGLGLIGLIAVAKWLAFLGHNLSEDSLHQTMADTTAISSIASPTELYWFLARLLLEGIVGATLLLSSLFITLKQVKRGMILGYYGLLLSLTTVDLLLFYFDQFSTILIALMQFIVLMGVIYYRKS